MQRIKYISCPVCGSKELRKRLTATDHTVSKEIFEIIECASCGLRLTDNVPDKDSIGPYYKSEDYISHTNTSKGIVNSLYHAVRKRTIRKKKNLIEKITGKRSGHLLDIGSGTGHFAGEMKKNGWIVTGLEPDEQARKIASEEHGIALQDISVFYSLPLKQFDAITLWHVLEHVHDLNGYISHFAKLLAPGGKLFIAVPNYTAKDAGQWKQHWAAYDVPRHLYHFSPKSMKTLLANHGLPVVKTLPMWFDSFYIAMLSSRYKTGKTKLMASFFSGLLSNFAALGNNEKCSSIIYIAESKS